MPHIWIDIETIPGKTQPDHTQIAAPANYKKPDAIEKFQLENVDKVWREQALNSIHGRILCISFAIGNEDPTCFGIWNHSEREILSILNDAIEGLALGGDAITWAGFNLHSFDLNWIFHRAVKYGFDDLTDNIKRDRYPKNVYDVRNLWTGGDPYGKGKMKDIARFLGLHIEDVDGSEVFDLYQAGEFEKIARYCNRDVALSREIAFLCDGHIRLHPAYSNLQIQYAFKPKAQPEHDSRSQSPVEEPA